MRILFLSRRYFPAISGMSVYARNLLTELVRAGHDVTMVSQYRADATGTAIYGGGPPPPLDGVRVVGRRSLGEENGGDWERDIEDMIATIRAEHARAPFDVLHAQYGYPTGWAALVAGRALGLPVVVSIQGGDGHWVGSCCEMHRQAMLRVIDHSARVLIGCDSFAREVAERLDVPQDRFTIVPGAVDVSRFSPDPRREPGEAAVPIRLLYHGRVDRRKGVLDFIEALCLLRDRSVAYQATISGIGPDLESARALCDERGLADRLAFTGYADYGQAADIYRDQDVFVSPTYAEGFSNTVLEAMASGLPIVSCRAVGVMDCIRDGENGLLVEPGDVGAQARCLERLAHDGALRRRLAAAALAECRQTYAWSAVAARIMDAYRDVQAERPHADFDPSLPRSECRYRAAPHLL
jgi:glycosyltransferase involved in cell wall biosynthesis